jgi:acetoin utilization deacetylase AcuC-like enzyme
MHEMRVYTHERFSFPVPAGHRFPIAKYRMTRAAVDRLSGIDILEGPAVAWRDVALAHDEAWVWTVRTGSLTRHQQAALGVPWSPALVVRTRHACGSTLAAARAALDDGVAACLGGGMHHATRDAGRGYCTFNDVAITIAALRGDAVTGRVLVLDLDVHQGDGNAELFADDPSVVVVSVHGARNYPFTRAASDLDIDLADGTGDAQYLDAVRRAVRFALARGPYTLAVLIAGADPWAGDTLGRLAISEDGLVRRDTAVITALRDAGMAVVVTLAGGYGAPLATTAAIHARTIAAAAAVAAG